MRIAVVADIHGNLDALDAVVAEIGEAAPDLVVDLGDCLSGPLDAIGTADRLIDLGWPTVRGNHDRQLLDRPVERMGPSDAVVAPLLSEAHRGWLAGLPKLLRPADGVLAFHGVPGDDLVYAAEDIVAGTTKLADPAIIRARLGETAETLLLGGHSHQPRLVDLGDNRLYLNPGSVGLPAYDDDLPVPHVVETGSPHARWALIDRIGGAWRVAFRTTVYDWSTAAARARAAGRPDWAEGLATGFRRRGF